MSFQVQSALIMGRRNQNGSHQKLHLPKTLSAAIHSQKIMASSSNADLVKRLSQLLKKVPVAEQDAILATCTLENRQNKPIRNPTTTSVLSEDNEEEEPIAPLIRKRKAAAQGEEVSRKKAAAATVVNMQSEAEQNPRSASTKSASPPLIKTIREDLTEERGIAKRTAVEKVERDREGKKIISDSEGVKIGKTAAKKMAKRMLPRLFIR